MAAEKKLCVGIVPSAQDPFLPSARLRGFNLCEALRLAGCDAFLCEPDAALKFDAVILARRVKDRYAWHEKYSSLLDSLSAAGIPAVFDFADEIAKAELAPELLKSFLGRCQLVSVSSLALKRLCEGQGLASNVVQLDDVVDSSFLERVPARAASSTDVPVIGWTGLAGNLDMFIPLFPVLRRLYAALPGRFRLRFFTTAQLHSRKYPVEETAELLKFSLGIPFELVEWDVAGSLSEIASWDIGLAPCAPAAKSGNRAMLAGLAGALPFATRNVDNEFVLPQELALPELLPLKPSEWLSGLEKAVVDGAWRQASAAKVKASLASRFSALAIGRRWLAAIESSFERMPRRKPAPCSRGFDSSEFLASIKKSVAERLAALPSRGVAKLALYGDGGSSPWLREFAARTPGLQIAREISDAELSAPLALGGVDAVLLFTDSKPNELARRLVAAGVPPNIVVDVFHGLPPGPYPASRP